MSKCKKCGNNIPSRINIDGKKRNLKNRKYCLNCSPFGQHNTRQIDKDTTTKPIHICEKCGKNYEGGHGKYKMICRSCKAMIWRTTIKQRAVDYLGGKCKICGYNRCIKNLHFHHLDPDKKEFQISGSTLGWERIKTEIEKCILLCSNCHTEVEYKIIDIPG